LVPIQAHQVLVPSGTTPGMKAPVREKRPPLALVHDPAYCRKPVDLQA